MTTAEGAAAWAKQHVLPLVLGGAALLFTLSCAWHDDFVDCVSPVAAWGLLGLWFLAVWFFTDRETRSLDRSYDPHWREVCQVLFEHTHEGRSVRGVWRGCDFHASATNIYLGPNGGTLCQYSVTMPVEPAGPAWRMKRVGAEAPPLDRRAWRLRADRVVTEERLAAAGLLDAVEHAERTADHFRGGARLSYDPVDGHVVYRDGSGAVPCATDFRVHLELVRQAVDIASTIPVDDGSKATHGLVRPRLRTGSPPVWALSLWFPAALIGLLTLNRWPWTLALLPGALVVPLAWRIRIGRR